MAASRLYSVEVWVHFGPTSPVVFSDHTVQNPSGIHMQCLAGVHFNPVLELGNFVTLSDVIAGHKFLVKTVVQDNVEEPNPELPNVMYITEETPKVPSCEHSMGPLFQCIVFVDDMPCCALMDTGAQVSLVNNAVFGKLNLGIYSSPDTERLMGFAGKSSKILGVAFITISFDNTLSDFPFAVVPSECVDFCFVLGQNYLKEACLTIDFASGKLLKEDYFTPDIGLDSTSNHDDIRRIMTIDNLVKVQMPLFTALVSLEKLQEIQGQHRQLRSIKKLVRSGEPASSLPKSWSKFRKVYSYLEVHHDLLLKKEKDGTLVCVIPFSFLIDLTIEVHLQYTHIGIYKMLKMLRRFVWHYS